MTCIVGLTHAGRVLIGGDSAGVNEDWNLAVRKDRKVVRNGEFVIGFSSSFRMGQLLTYALNPPKHHPDTDIMQFMVVDFVNAVRTTFKEGGFGEEDEGEKGGYFLVGFKSRLFQICRDFQVMETVNGFDACGCADMQALGSLWSTRGWEDPRARVIEALECAEAFSAGVRGPFVIEECGGWE